MDLNRRDAMKLVAAAAICPKHDCAIEGAKWSAVGLKVAQMGRIHALHCVIRTEKGDELFVPFPG